MLSKTQRLNLSKDFRFIAKGRKVETPSLKLMFKILDDTIPLIGIALSKSNFKRAHERNQARRKVSAAIESVYPSLKRGLNLVIMPKAQIINKDKNELADELKNVKDIYTVN